MLHDSSPSKKVFACRINSMEGSIYIESIWQQDPLIE